MVFRTKETMITHIKSNKCFYIYQKIESIINRLTEGKFNSYKFKVQTNGVCLIFNGHQICENVVMKPVVHNLILSWNTVFYFILVYFEICTDIWAKMFTVIFTLSETLRYLVLVYIYIMILRISYVLFSIILLLLLFAVIDFSSHLYDIFCHNNPAQTHHKKKTFIYHFNADD